MSNKQGEPIRRHKSQYQFWDEQLKLDAQLRKEKKKAQRDAFNNSPVVKVVTVSIFVIIVACYALDFIGKLLW